MLAKCFDRRVLIGLAAVAAGVLILDRSVAFRYLPLLICLACPLSMLLMMRPRSAGLSQAGQMPIVRNDWQGGGGSGPSSVDEVTRLRAEVDQLRAEREGRPSPGTEQAEYGVSPTPESRT